MNRWAVAGITLLGGVACAAGPSATSGDPARGKAALLGKAYVPPTMTYEAYQNVWKQWGLRAKPAPADYDRLFRERYGLHAAPYPNGGYPMGMRPAEVPFGLGTLKGLSADCMVCHGGSIFGKSYVGLGNSTLDYQTFYEEMSAADGRKRKTPFVFSNVRGTTEAGGMAVFLLGYRDPDLTLRSKWIDLDLHDDLCEDVPAWWLLKKKKTMYHNGGTDTRAVRSLMQFMMSPLNFPADFERAEKDFVNIRAYLLTVEAPKYPLPIDRKLAVAGHEVFTKTCSRCHGTYGEKWAYPNKVIPIDEIGTDRRRYDGITAKFGAYYNKSWFAAEYHGVETAGYQAPPLDGVWATAPYFHNGSAPTAYHVLNSKARPKVFTRSYRTDPGAYDARRLGWKVEELPGPPNAAKLSPRELRQVYDTTKPGRGNSGHTYGDRLTEEQRAAVIEYLKTL